MSVFILLNRFVIYSRFLLLLQHVYLSQAAVKSLAINEKQKDFKRWKTEVLSSLKKNIHNCSYNVNIHQKKSSSSFNRLFKYTDLQIEIYFPTKKDIQTYRNMPATLSAGNKYLLDIVNSQGIQEFKKEKGDRWMIPVEHPGQDRVRCVDFTELLGKGHIAKFYERYKVVNRTYYLIKGEHGLIHPTGMVMFACGTYQGKENCETRWDHDIEAWRKSCTDYKLKYISSAGGSSKSSSAVVGGGTRLTDTGRVQSSSYSDSWQTLLQHVQDINHPQAIKACNFNQTAAKHVKHIYLVTAVHDTNFHHLIADSLARMVHSLPFLRKNPDIFIHIRQWEFYYRVHVTYHMQPLEIFAAERSRNQFFELLGIDTKRLISGNVVADEVFIPRAMSCSFSLFNPIEYRLIADELIQRTKLFMSKRRQRLPSKNSFQFDYTLDRKTVHPISIYYQADDIKYLSAEESVFKKKNIIILHRQGGSSSWGLRVWSEEQYINIEIAFQKAFPNHNIIRHPSSAIIHPDFCMACEISELR